MLTLKPTDLGSGKLKDDFVVLDADRKTVGRILWTHAASRETPWFLDNHGARAAVPARSRLRADARGSDGGFQGAVGEMKEAAN